MSLLPARAGSTVTSAWATAGSAPGEERQRGRQEDPGEHADQCPRCVESGPRLSGRRVAHGSAARLRAVREGASVRIPRDSPLSCSTALRGGSTPSTPRSDLSARPVGPAAERQQQLVLRVVGRHAARALGDDPGTAEEVLAVLEPGGYGVDQLGVEAPVAAG